MKPTDLRGILQYIPRFRDKTFVIAVDGAIVADDNFANILLDIAVLRSLNIQVVLVHGASALIVEMAGQQGITASDLDGTGITDTPTLELSMNAANRLTHEILEGLAANDLRAASSNAIVAHPKGIINGIDHQGTGKVERVDVDLLRTLLQQGIIPVIPPLGFDGERRTFRLNSDEVALAVAQSLSCIKLVYITTTAGLIHDGELIRQMQCNSLTALLEDKQSAFGAASLSKARHAAEACMQGIPRAHVIDGRVYEGLLAEVFSSEGIGTLIYANEYQQIRPAKKKDIRMLRQLTQASVAKEELQKRTRAELERKIHEYYIFETDRNPIGCVALHQYPECNKGELASLCVSPSHENQGIGAKLIQFVCAKARQLNLDQLFVLSTQTFNYFRSKGGFTEGTVDDLPEERHRKYNQSKRNSKILILNLDEGEHGVADDRAGG